MKKFQMFIGGKLVDAADGKVEAIIDPATQKAIAEVPVGSAEDVQRAVKAAAGAFDKWSQTPPKDRAAALLAMADILDRNAAELAQLESSNVGKPITLAEVEMPFMSDNLRFFASAARCMEGRVAGEYMADRTSWIRREPVGVVGSIAPWNYPLMMAVWKIGPALAAGNTVVLKPAETTPLTTLRLAELVSAVLPPGVLNVVTGYGRPVGQALVEHPQVNMVSLTGDVGTGKTIARVASETLKRVHLELGGKAPVIVFDDADMNLVVQGIRANGYMNSGQDCTAACRVYAKKPIYDKLVSELGSAVSTIKVGDVADRTVEMGPMVSDRQRQRVAGFVDRAKASGHGEVVTGGKARSGAGFFYEPTVVAGAQQSDEIVQKEVFGPVVTITRFGDDEEAIRWANDVAYGLSASVWTNNVNRALEVSRRLRFGTVWINDHCTLVSEMPHGGFKESGYGSDMGVYSVNEYTVVKHVMAKINR
jgi:1-pyrroline dehydrogenase